MRKLIPWVLVAGSFLLAGLLLGYCLFRPAQDPAADLARATRMLWDLDLTGDQLRRLQPDLEDYRQAYRSLRASCPPPNALAPALEFHPRPAAAPPAWLAPRPEPGNAACSDSAR